MADNWQKKERENKKKQSQRNKEEKKQQRRENRKDGNDLDSMMAYIDENGNLSTTPPDPSKKKAINIEDISIGVSRQSEDKTSHLERTGVLTSFNTGKGFGFIKDDISGQSFFVHVSSMLTPVNESSRVSFEIEKGPRGPVAVRVQVILK